MTRAFEATAPLRSRLGIGRGSVTCRSPKRLRDLRVFSLRTLRFDFPAGCRFGCTLAAAIAAATLPACRPAPDASPPIVAAIPSPDLAQVEKPVAERITSARAAVEAAPKSAEAWGRLGMVLHAHELYAEAVIAYRRAGELAPADHRWPYLAGVALGGTDIAAALPMLEQAQRLAPRQSHVLRAYADALVGSGRDANAMAAYEAALSADANDHSAMAGLAELLMRREELPRALELLQRAEALAFEDHGVHEKLARLHRRLGDTALARREALLAAAHPRPAPVYDPDHAAVDAEAVSSQARTQRGLSRVRRGDFEGALREFSAVAAVRPALSKDHANIAGALAGLGRFDESLKHFDAAVAATADDVDLRVSFATALLHADRADAAEKQIEAALAINPRADGALYAMGLLRQQQGRIAEAADAYRGAIAINPVNAPAHNNLAMLLVGAGRMDDARQEWSAAIECGFQAPEAAYNLAMSYYLVGDFARADDELTRALARYAENPLFLAGLAAIRATAPDAAQRNGGDALTLARRLMKQSGPNHAGVLDLLAAAYAAAGDFAQAAANAERAAELARAAGDQDLAAAIESRLQLYRQGQAFRQQPGRPYVPPMLPMAPVTPTER